MSSALPILLDCDTGIDDAYALVLALRASDRLNVVAVTCVAGNASVSNVVRNTQAVVSVAAPHQVPPVVAKGMANAFVEPSHFCPQIHGNDGLGDLALAQRIDARGRLGPLDARHAVQVISDAARDYAGELTLVALAPLTNVAAALRIDPDIRTRLKRIVLMGGAVRIGGNMRPWAEANIADDPEAAHIVFTSGVEIVMYPWDVFERFNLPRSVAERLADSSLPHARLVGQIMLSELNRFKSDTASMGDAGTIVYLLDPDAATIERRHVSVELAGKHTRGMTVVDLRPVVHPPDEESGPPNVSVVSAIDAERFRATFLRYVLAGDDGVSWRKQVGDAVERVRDFAERSTRGRDESHGFRHLCDVLALAERICDELVVPVGSPPLERDLVRIAALLHDVCDHKYDHDGKLRATMEQFLAADRVLAPQASEILWIVDTVSYSKEAKSKGENLRLHAGDGVGLARDIVSDADKITALGAIGLERCRRYAHEQNPSATEAQLDAHVIEHAHEKLLRLLPLFIRTEPGKRLAQPEHDHLAAAVIQLETKYSK
jgi:pyrimidine-specific ribonucleoside hydrolase